MSAADARGARAEALIGQVLKHKWRIDALLGTGGMASVFAATHRNGHRVAIKLLHLELSMNLDLCRRFSREGYAANAVPHPGVVRVLDDDVTDNGEAFLVMDLLEGESLEAYAARCAPCDPVFSLSVLHGVLDVLEAAHAKGIVHRDVKPENIYLTQDGGTRLLDFGIAQIRDAHQSASMATRAGSTLGTPAYMAPEQALAHADKIDARTDVWAVGATAYRLLTGKTVHEGSTLNEQLVFAATRPAPPLDAVVPSLPRPVVELVGRALAFERDDRFASARAMQDAIASVLPSLGAPLTPASGTVPRAPVARETHASRSSAAVALTPAGHTAPFVTSSAGPLPAARSGKRLVVWAGVALAAAVCAGSGLVVLRAHRAGPRSISSAPPLVPATTEPGSSAPPTDPTPQATPPAPPPNVSASAKIAPTTTRPTRRTPSTPAPSPSTPPAMPSASAKSWLDQR
jgi:serine/threonine-protein kinase